MKRATREWIKKAEADFRAAQKLQRGNDPLHDQSCFFCQQAAEKYLKVLLEELGVSIPRIHRLQDLQLLLLPHYASLRSLRRGLVYLTRFAVGTRYPGDSASKRDAASALRWTGKVRDACRSLLGLRPPSRRRKRP